jgi:hypothetical protein
LIDEWQVFRASFATTALSTAAGGHDLLTITSSGLSRFEVMRVVLQEVSTTPTSIGVEIFRGSPSTPSGAAVVPAPISGWPTAPAAKCAVNQNSASTMSTSGATRLFAGGFEIDSGAFRYEPVPAPSVVLNSRWHMRTGVLPVATAIQGTVTFREIGRMPST